MCSTFTIGTLSKKILAQNYDFTHDHGLVGVNLKGTMKENGRQPGEPLIRWQVKYGSITMNQFSLELPVSGMNERGLSVALMWHDEGDFGDGEQFARLNALQWIQYQLDNYQSISEVVEGLESIRPKKEAIPLHYFLLDASGDSLLVEFIGGELTLYTNPEFPLLTNSSYRVCLERVIHSSSRSKPSTNSSMARFHRLYELYKKHDQTNNDVSTGFDWLDSVSQSPGKEPSFPWDMERHSHTITAWSIVFSPTAKTIFLKTNSNATQRIIHLNDFDFSKDSNYLVLDINDGMEGNVRSIFKPYSIELNQRLICQTAKVFPMTEAEQEALANLVDMLYQHRNISLG